MIVGYARTSTTDQQFGLDAQIEQLTAAGCEKIVTEQASSVGKRTEWARLVEFVREGDILVVTKLDRLARSVRDFWNIADTLQRKGVVLRIMNMNLDTTTATGKLMLSLLGSVAEFEREIMLERQREGIQKARHAGKLFGRKPTARQKGTAAVALAAQGVGAREIAERMAISRASVYRIIATYRADD